MDTQTSRRREIIAIEEWLGLATTIGGIFKSRFVGREKSERPLSQAKSKGGC